MTSNLFFVDRKMIAGRAVVLGGAEHHHLARVVRARPGDVIVLFDQDGNRYEARVETVAADRTQLALIERLGPVERRSQISLGQALLKAKGMDLVVQKAAEFGLFAIHPILAERSVARIEETNTKKIERWTRIAREASKQSKWGLVPRIHPPSTLADFLQCGTPGFAFFLSEKGGRPLHDLLGEWSGPPPEAATALVGPEGGWTRQEEADMRGAGCAAVSLGRAILRAETAALATAAILSHFWIS